ncbi:unnamed protein product, partial [marine sediment metagenome]
VPVGDGNQEDSRTVRTSLRRALRAVNPDFETNWTVFSSPQFFILRTSLATKYPNIMPGINA